MIYIPICITAIKSQLLRTPSQERSIVSNAHHPYHNILQHQLPLGKVRMHCIFIDEWAMYASVLGCAGVQQELVDTDPRKQEKSVQNE